MSQPQTNCRVCGAKAAWNIPGTYGEPVLVLCAKHGAADYPKEECAGCGMVVRIDGQAVRSSTSPHTYSQLVFCAHCNQADLKCGACFTSVGFRSSGMFPQTATFRADGGAVGYRCAFCNEGSLDTVEATEDLTRGAMTWVTTYMRAKGYGMPDVSGRIEYHLSDSRTLAGGDSGQTLGRCTRTVVEGSGNRYRVDVLVGMRPVSFVETLVHELTHVWAFETKRDKREYIEGFCNFAAHTFLDQFGTAGSAERQEAQRRQALMMEDRSPIYGSNFRAFKMLSQNSPNIVKYFVDSADKKS